MAALVVRRRIRMFPDYGNQWSLWENGTESYIVDPTDLGLPDELKSSLARWTVEWEDVQHLGSGGSESWDAWVESGRALSFQIASWVGDFARIQFEADRYG